MRDLRGGGANGLILDIPRQRVVEIELFAIQLELGRAHVAVGEQLPDFAGLWIGELDQCFLEAAQVERRLVFSHRLLQALDVAVHVAIKKTQEQPEVLRIPLVRRRGHQQEMIGALGQGLAKLKGQRLLLVAIGAHLVRLIHNDQIPVRSKQALFGVIHARDPGHRCHDLVLVLPRILTVLRAQRLAPHYLEVLTELVSHFSLPLERQVGGCDDERTGDEAADLQLLQEEPGHDGLASARIVGQQEPNPRQLQEILVDRLKLVWQRVDPCD